MQQICIVWASIKKKNKRFSPGDQILDLLSIKIKYFCVFLFSGRLKSSLVLNDLLQGCQVLVLVLEDQDPAGFTCFSAAAEWMSE